MYVCIYILYMYIYIYMYIYVYIYMCVCVCVYHCKTIKLYLKGIDYNLIMICISTVVCVIMTFLRNNKT